MEANRNLEPSAEPGSALGQTPRQGMWMGAS